MTDNTRVFNIFPVFFRGKTGGFGGRGAEGGHSLGKPRRVGKETAGGIFRQKQGAEIEARGGKAFFKTERDDPNQHKAPAPKGAGALLSQLR